MSNRSGFMSKPNIDWPWWAGPALLSLVLALLFIDPFVGDWDAIDYTILALKGAPSSMALGRTLFIFSNRGLWLLSHSLFQLPPENAYLLFKYAVVIETPLAVIASWYLARQLRASRQAATLAALLIATSPVFVLYSGQAMTEIPSILLLAVALTVHSRGLQTRNAALVLTGAAVLGLGVNVRESVGFFAPWLLLGPFVYGWRFHRRDIAVTLSAGVVFTIFAASGFAFWYITDIGHYRDAWDGWRASMAMESARHPVSLWNAGPFALLLLASSPFVMVPLPLAFYSEWRRHRISPMLAMAAVGLFATVLLLLNYSTTVNWRYCLTALPVFAPLTAVFLIRALTDRGLNERRALTYLATTLVAFTAVAALIARPIFNRTMEKHALTKSYRDRLVQIPSGAVVMAGGESIAVKYWSSIGPSKWEEIGTGGGWPGEKLLEVIARYLEEGRRVFIDTDPRLWSPCGWQKSETEQLPSLEKSFRFRRAGEGIYEIRPVGDVSANDDPALVRLLPENRRGEIAKCLK
jgi:hypothetical protein